MKTKVYEEQLGILPVIKINVQLLDNLEMRWIDGKEQKLRNRAEII